MEIACRSRAALLTLLVLLAAPGARAQLAPPEASCPVAPEWARSADAREGPASVQVRISGGPSHWLATLRVRYENGSAGLRQLSAASCAELQRAVAVTLSLLEASSSLPEPDIAPGTVAAAAKAARESPVPVSSAAPDVAPSVALAPALLAAARRAGNTEDAGPERDGQEPDAHARRGFLRVSSLWAIAGDRFAELGAALAGGVWLGSWGARAELSARQPLVRVPAERGFSLQLQRYALGLEPCVRRLGAVEWGVCTGPRLELVRGLAVGPSEPAADAVWLPGWGGGSWLRLPLSATWALSAELQSSWSLRRAQASVLPWGKIYELPRLDSSLLFGAEWTL